MLKKVLEFLSKNRLKKWILIFLGSLSWSLTMVRSGLCWDASCIGGLGFWGPNGHDGIWHLALINSLSKGTFQAPVFSGWSIQNYHIGFDLIVSWISKLTFINSSILYFQIIPPILAIAIGILTYKFIKDWTKSSIAAFWSTFFVYFGGSFGWIISMIRERDWGGESMFWSQQSISTLINPPFALSLVIILAGLIFLIKYLDNRSKLNLFLAAFFFGISIFIKVYAGLLVLASLLAGSIWELLRKKDFKLFGVFVTVFVISFVLFIPFNKLSSGLIVFAPFWFLESMMALSDRFNWQKLYSAMTTYRMGHVWAKAVLAYLLAFAIFVLGNFGTRITALGIFISKKIKNFDLPEIFLITLISAGIVVPTFFVQKGTPWNTIQFFYYSLIFGGIIAGVEFGRITSRVSILKKYLLISILVILTIPTTFASLRNYLPPVPASILPKTEETALKFLADQPNGVVLTYPFDKNNSGAGDGKRPLYVYTSTAYVSAYSGKPVYFEDEINLDIMQYPWSERKRNVQEFLNTLDQLKAGNFLKENNIVYIYWLHGQHARIGDKQLGLTRIFENEGATIFRVNR